MFFLFTFLMIILVSIVSSCKKDFSRQPVVTTGDFDLASAIAHGTLVDLGTKEIIDHGFCWDSLGEPNLAQSRIRLGALSKAGDFQVQLTSLRANKSYNLKAFISFGEEVLYGAVVTFTTPDLPTITTSPMTEITATFAKCGGEITSDNGSPVLSRGVCWGSNSNPDTTSNHTFDGTGIGVFESVLSGLSANTTYYVRAYATSIYGIRYANELAFNTGQSATTPYISTNPVSDITQTGASCGGNVVADGGSSVTLRGVCWSTNPYPTTADSKTEDGSGTGVFSSSLSDLTANTTYYVRAYATNSVGTAYGNEIGFTTGQNITTPIVYTNEVTSIAQTTATCGGNVIGDGGAMVTARGVCWSTSPNPTTEDNKTIDGNGIGLFVSYLSGLSANTLYYVAAYATNSVGTAYGSQVTFTTLSGPILPTVTTNNDVNNITQTTATSGGNVTSDGGAAITARGVCWNTSPIPTLANSHTIDGSGTGMFVSNLTGLTQNTHYYIRAYATNNTGTAYGNEVSFTTLSNWSCGDPITITHLVSGGVAPVDKTVSYGTVTNIPGEPTKCWITSNLGADHQATAVNDTTEASAGWYWQFNRKQGYRHDGSFLIPAWTISVIIENSDWLSSNDPCTIELGNTWRIPTYTEWNNVNTSGGWTNWNGPWNSGLKLHAGGYLMPNGGWLYDRGSQGHYYTGMQFDDQNAREFGFTSTTTYVGWGGKAYGFTLRCIKD